MAVYRVNIRGVRTTPGDRWEEKLTYTQEGRLTLVNLEQPKKGTAVRAWMMELDEPKIASLTRDDQRVVDLPAPRTMGLPPRIVQLKLNVATSERAPASAVGGSWVQRGATLLALDFAHWPNALVGEGDSWESETEREELNGKWTHRYTSVEGERGDRLAVGDFSFAGRLAGRFEDVATIEQVTGTWKWLVAKRSLASSQSDVMLKYGAKEEPRQLAMHVELALESRDHVPAEMLAQARTDVNELGKLATAVADPANKDAKAKLEEFIAHRGDSLWLPVARDVLKRAEYDERVLAGMSAQQLVDRLTALITAWQHAALSGKIDSLQPLRATFRELVETNRSEVYALLSATDPNVRAMAVFCVAFGDDDSDLAHVKAGCKDDEARVRAWAAYGLAERRETGLEPDLLLSLLADKDEKVRQRACMAVGACVPAGSEHREQFFNRLLEMVQTDDSINVRVTASAALAGLATKSDLPALIDTEFNLDIPPANRILSDTIRRLGGEPKELPDDDNDE